MILTSTTYIKTKHAHFKILREMSRRGGALYNSMIYELNKFKEVNGEYLSLGKLDIHMKTHKENLSYRRLPAQISQQKVKEFIESYKSFFALLKKKQNKTYDKEISKPKYKSKGHFSTLTFAKQSFRIKNDKILLSIPKDVQELNNIKFAEFQLPNNIVPETVRQIKITPTKNKSFKLLIQYDFENLQIDNRPVERFASINLGINNLATITSNVCKPLLVNGKPIKSFNRYFNKKIAKENSRVKKRHKENSSKELRRLWSTRGMQINAILHKISSIILEYALTNQLDLIIIGLNKGWKQEVSLGRKTNQKFVQIPHSKLIQLISYKLLKYGIKVITTEESYTSKCSYFDQEKVQKQTTYKGARIKRGLFITNSGFKVNADVNGSLNIGRKYMMKNKNVFHDVALQPVDIGLVVNPVRWNISVDDSIECINKFLVTLQIDSVKLIKKINNCSII